VSNAPEPIGEWMRSQGFPPEKCFMVLPLRLREAFKHDCPPYVRFSNDVSGNTALLLYDVLPELKRGAA
jgi:hypothetical protein